MAVPVPSRLAPPCWLVFLPDGNGGWPAGEPGRQTITLTWPAPIAVRRGFITVPIGVIILPRMRVARGVSSVSRLDERAMAR